MKRWKCQSHCPDHLRRDKFSRFLVIGYLKQPTAIACCLSHLLKGLPCCFHQWFPRHLLIADNWGSGLGSCAGGSVLQTRAPLSSFLPIYLWHLCCLLLPLAFFLFCFCLSLVRSDTASSWSHGEDFFFQCAHTCWGFKVIELAVGAVCIAEPLSPHLN